MKMKLIAKATTLFVAIALIGVLGLTICAKSKGPPSASVADLPMTVEVAITLSGNSPQSPLNPPLEFEIVGHSFPVTKLTVNEYGKTVSRHDFLIHPPFPNGDLPVKVLIRNGPAHHRVEWIARDASTTSTLYRIEGQISFPVEGWVAE